MGSVLPVEDLFLMLGLVVEAVVVRDDPAWGCAALSVEDFLLLVCTQGLDDPKLRILLLAPLPDKFWDELSENGAAERKVPTRHS